MDRVGSCCLGRVVLRVVNNMSPPTVKSALHDNYMMMVTVLKPFSSNFSDHFHKH